MSQPATDAAPASLVPPGQPAPPGASSPSTLAPAAPKAAVARPPPAGAPASRTKGLWHWIAGSLALLVGAIFGGPWLIHLLNTVSTDDAYVNGHVTFVAPRVPGQVARVLVDDNNRVRKGDVLIELDPEPYQVQVDIAAAAVDAAQADLVLTRAQVRGQEAQTRSLRYNLARAIEDVHNQVALLRARIATWQSQQASVLRAQSDYDRAKPLVESKVVTGEDFDRRREALQVAQAREQEALEGVYQLRVALGLPRLPPNGDLADVPADLDQTFSSVREAQASLMEAAAQLGVFNSFNKSPQEMLDDFYRRDPQGNVDNIFAELLESAPAIKQAQTKLEQAQRNLEQAQLNLRYCSVVAEIDGVVTRRNVNPGNYVVAGQSLMAVRSLTEIWVDANFKETQLARLRLGQLVELETDTYGRSHPFTGRIAGFTMGTGSTLALLPPQNATGNFVKVVQRLPVRIEVLNYDPEKKPLFVGLSVTAVALLNEKPTGPDAGKVLQPYLPLPALAPEPPLPGAPGASP